MVGLHSGVEALDLSALSLKVRDSLLRAHQLIYNVGIAMHAVTVCVDRRAFVRDEKQIEMSSGQTEFEMKMDSMGEYACLGERE